jgi:oligopeptide transport system permease protein
MIFATVGISIPSFVLTVLLLYLFAVVLKWLPTFGLTTWKHYLLPVTGLAVAPIAYIARLMRSSMLEVMRQDYIRTARAKGLTETVVVLRHVLKGALLPVVSYLGPAFAGIITGTVVVETIFAIPGMGRLSIQAAINRDYTLIMGDVIVFSVILVVMNFVVDLCYGFLDPRISYS